ncbi:MAG: hypothetical protein IJB78_06080 [Oscillospiraceae bacterium]|nr:hypothetical protein [Oscillospiraceae bacterium]
MKKFLTWFSLGVFLFVGIFACVTMADMPRTYDGTQAAVSVYELQQDPASYDDSVTDGAAGAIVQQNLDKVHAVNDVTSIVFDFRGYDTMGEAFILITAVAGSIVILYNAKKEKKEEDKDE